MSRVFGVFSVVVFSVLVSACAGSPTQPNAQGDEGPLYVVPANWEIVDERDGNIYQANLRNNAGAGRMLVGRLPLKSEVTETEAYLFKLHNQLVDKLKGEVDVAPFSEERLAWTNGVVGYRTRMRGELDRKVVIYEGIALTDGKSAYFHYGMFPENVYSAERAAYTEVLGSLAPIRGAQRQKNVGLEIGGAMGSEIGADGATSPQDYPDSQTHLGMVAWGTSRQAVEQATGLPPRKGANAIGYRCQFLGTDDCFVVYMFEKGLLTHGGFLLENQYENPQDHVARYLTMTKTLTERYGRPTQSAAIWNDTSFKNDGKRWGEALKARQVIFGTVWQLDGIKIVHSLLTDEEGTVEHRILLSNDAIREGGAK